MEAAFTLTALADTPNKNKKINKNSGWLKHDLGDLIYLAGSGWSAMEVLLAPDLGTDDG